ncbi:MAG: biotin--[acetyl-CoA-carboxylase] ligase [Candidatus Aminicenantes bacterium]|nr:biotin--[acetyl-CoA-carboxylase] ligase [Candidatus Aminicenantes bacterium]
MMIGGKILYFRRLTSTNDLARELAIQGEEEGTVIVADEQTAGRGTKGRIWYSAFSLGLYASIILRPKRMTLSLLPLAMGLACREALNEAFNLEVVLKWPNDLIINKRKLGGLLLESSFSGGFPTYAIFGLGLNLNHEANDFPEEIRERAISLRQVCGRKIDREAILNLLWPKINFWYQTFLQGRDAEIIASFERGHLYSRGEEVSVVLNGREIIGQFDGFTHDGALRLTTGRTILTITTGEINSKK